MALSDGCSHRLHRLYRLSAVQRRELSAGQESLQRQVREIAGQKVVKAVKAVSPQRQGRCSSNACDIEHFESFSLKHTIA